MRKTVLLIVVMAVWAYGTVIGQELPEVQALNVYGVTSGSAMAEGEVLSDGGSDITEQGFVWAKYVDPSIDNHDGIIYLDVNESSFSGHISHLFPGTFHYVRAFASNESGTVYSNPLAFKTKGFAFEDITLEFIESQNLSSNTINASNNHTNQIPTGTILFYQTSAGRFGKLQIQKYDTDLAWAYLTIRWVTYSEQGIVYSEGENMVLSSQTFDLDAGVIASKDWNNDFWVLHHTSIERTFTPVNGALFAKYQEISHSTGEGFTDLAGNFYPTVIIGNQEWATVNLRTTHYADGSVVPTNLNDEEWDNATSGAYSIYPYEETNYNSEEEIIEKFGFLYNWFAATHSSGLCPVGWEVPSTDQRNHLINFIKFEHEAIDNNNIAYYLKDREGYWTPTLYHDFGFNARPSGIRGSYPYGSGYIGIDDFTNFWFSDPIEGIWGNTFRLQQSQGNINYNMGYKYWGASVRCMRDLDEVSLASVVTLEASDIVATLATSGGVVESNDYESIAGCGIIWRENEVPTLADYDGITYDHLTDGQFISHLTGLNPGSEYFAISYVINAAGFVLGDTIFFETPELTVAQEPLGEGTINNPYIIETLSNLLWISENPDQWDKHYYQVQSIDAYETYGWLDEYGWNVELGWSPIGNDDNWFKGSYNGWGNTISRLFINREYEDNIGLFGRISEGTISNLILQDVDITGKDHVGGIVGRISHWPDSIYNCHVSGQINGQGYVGGIAGLSSNVIISACSFEGHVGGKVDGEGMAGGITGFATGSSILLSSSKGSVTGSEWVGGIVGYAHHNLNIIKNNYSRSVISGVTSIGGLIGNAYANNEIINCYSTGEIIYAGWPDDLIYYEVGGLLGGAAEGITVENSYWDMLTSGQNTSAGGEGRTTDQMTFPYAENTFQEWDFDSIWIADEGLLINDGYPYLADYSEISSSPVLVISNASQTEANTFSVTGYLVYEGGVPLDALGVIWGASPDPDLDNNDGIIQVDANVGKVFVELDSLNYTTTYYAVLYAQTADIVVYSNALAFELEVPAFAGGTGTESDPWLIEIPEHLNNVRHFIGINNADKHFKQIADINLGVAPWNEGEGWVPIGGQGGWFWGHYDGDGHTISNLYINRNHSGYQGLFDIHLGTIENLGVVDANVTDHEGRAGILVGLVHNWSGTRGQLINCYTTGTITSDHEDGRIGGLVGWNDGDIYDSWSSAEVFTTGTIAGGLAGSAHGGTFIRVHASGNVSGDSRIGGLVGNLQGGGIISESYASGNISCTDSHAGGLVGTSLAGSQILNSYATGMVNSPNGAIGGLVGAAYGSQISHTYAVGMVETQGLSGGLVADVDTITVVEKSYWDVFTTGTDVSDGGQGLPTHEMIQQLSFENWDYDQVWSIEEGESYPWLQWQQEAGIHNYPAFETYSVSAEVYPLEAGTIQGAGFYPEGTLVTLTAQANQGYSFLHWSEDGEILEDSLEVYVFEVHADRHLVAHFEPHTYTIMATASPSSGGDINGVQQYTGTYQHGEEVSLLANAADGYGFVGWIEGPGFVETAAEYTFTATGNRSLVAWFGSESVAITATANPASGGSVLGSGVYNPGEPVTLIAEAAPGYHFLNWSEDGVIIEGAGAVYGFIAETSRNLVVNFATQSYTITALANPANGGEVTGGGDYAHGAMVNLNAVPAEGYRFVSWKAGNTIVSTQPHYSFEATANKHLVASFVLKTYTISLESYPTNNLGGSAAGGGTFAHGTEISVVASPNAGYDFGWWDDQGAVASEDNVYTFTVTSDRELTAHFEGGNYLIDASVAPAGTGVVQGGGSYHHGEIVHLQAEGAFVYSFLRWMEGDNQVSVNSNYLFTASQDRELHAEFIIQWWNDDKKEKDNTVLVTASAEPVNVGVVLGQGYYEIGETVTLEASPNVGIDFVGWQDEGGDFILGEDNQLVGPVYTFTANENVALTAVFEGDILSVDVNAQPANGGEVTVSQNGLFYEGEFAQVSATANTGYIFEKWTLGVDGPQVSVNPQYGFTVSDSKLLVAHFAQQDDYVLALAAIPEEGGEVSGDGTFLPGTEVSIEAVANEGYTFQYWSTGNELFGWLPDTTFVLQSHLDIDANFLINTYHISTLVYPEATGTVTGGGAFEHGDQVTLTASPLGGYHFVKWMENDFDVVDDNDDLVGSTYVFAAYENRALEAVFAPNVYNVSVAASPELGGMVTGAGEYTHLEQVTVTATANEDYAFSHWTQNGVLIPGAQESHSFNITSHKDFVAHFDLLIELYEVVFEVIDEEGADIADAVITFDGTTYAAGTYSIGEFEAGTYDYLVQREGYHDAEGTVEVTDADVVEVVTLMEIIPQFNVSFEVIDEEGADIADAVITFDGATYAAGTYNLGEFEAGTYDYLVQREGYHDAEGTVEVTDADVVEVVTLMEEVPVFTLTFEIQDEEQQIIPDAIIILNGHEYDPGVYVFADLEAGNYDYEIQREGYFTVSDNIQLTEDLTLTIILEEDDTSVEIIYGNAVRVFPNPANSEVNITSGKIMDRITITDITGKTLHNANVLQKHARISLEGLQAGIYIVHVYIEDGVVVKKLQVNR